MTKSSKTALTRICAFALSFALCVPVGIFTKNADAASKVKFTKSKVSVKVGKTVKLSLKGKKIKKTKYSVKNKKLVKLSAKKATSVKVKGLKKGSTVITAKGKSNNKTFKAVIKVTVTKKQTTTKQQATAKPSATATPVPVPTKAPETAKPTETPNPQTTPLVNYEWDFEGADGKGDLGKWTGRYNDDPEADNGSPNAKFDLIEKSEDEVDGNWEGHGNYAARITGRTQAWNGISIDLSDCITYDAKYKVSMDVKIPAKDADGKAVKFGTNDKTRVAVRLSAGYLVDPEGTDDDKHYDNWPADVNQYTYCGKWTHIEEIVQTPPVGSWYELYIETSGFGKAPLMMDNVKIERISAPREYDPTLPSLKDAYSKHFDKFGAAISYENLLSQNYKGFITKHHNSITPGNEFKMDSLMGKAETYKLSSEEAKDYIVSEEYKKNDFNKDADGDIVVPKIDFKKLDKFMKTAKENGLKIRVHSPIWHSQNPGFFFMKNYKEVPSKVEDGTINKEDVVDQETMFQRESLYVRTLLHYICNSPYGDTVYAYDVVNEYIHMPRSTNAGIYYNFWAFMFGNEMQLDSKYVKTAYAEAYKELEEHKRTEGENKISLIYNDFSTYDVSDEVVTLINNINKKDDLNPEGKKICDGIGMQSHVGINGGSGSDVISTGKYLETVNKFAKEGFEIQITELDISAGTVKADTDKATKDKIEKLGADAYAKLFDDLMTAKDNGANITSVTLWGLTDATSWLPDNSPLLFGVDLADKKPAFDAVIAAAANHKCD